MHVYILLRQTGRSYNEKKYIKYSHRRPRTYLALSLHTLIHGFDKRRRDISRYCGGDPGELRDRHFPSSSVSPYYHGRKEEQRIRKKRSEGAKRVEDRRKSARLAYSRESGPKVIGTVEYSSKVAMFCETCSR